MAETTAWLLNLDGELNAAVGEREMIHVIQSPSLFAVPDCPPYCRHVLVWQDLIVPVMDLAVWLKRHGMPRPEPTMAGIFAYHGQNDIAYGALLLTTIPIRRPVNDTQACELPDQPAGWGTVAISCFAEGDKAVPVLDLGYIFSDALLKVGWHLAT